MLGNLWEWVEDCWHENYDGGPKDGSAWEEPNDGDCAQRVIRGGSWTSERGNVRSAYRYGFAPGYLGGDIGFRLAQDH